MPTGPKIDPFKPQQPQIPGVPAKTEPLRSSHDLPLANPAADLGSQQASVSPAGSWSNWLRVGAAAAVVIVILGVAWWVRVSSAKPAEQPVSVPVHGAETVPVKSASLPLGPGEIATESKLQRAWSSQRFLFQNPATGEMFPALAVRLPGGALWGISLRETFGRCELEYVTNLDMLRSKYGLRATHPLVADPCTGTVYDLSQYANGPNGLVRGQVVRGRADRPPIAVEIEQHGDSIVAVRMESTQ